MKTLCVLILLFAVGTVLLAHTKMYGFDDVENLIRRLDHEEAEAILKKDGKALDHLTSEDFIVNSPRNEIIKGRDAVKSFFYNGVINYVIFDRQIESVMIYDNTAVVMGHETVITESGQNTLSQPVNRRYTNIWIKRNGQWLLSARQASIICP